MRQDITRRSWLVASSLVVVITLVRSIAGATVSDEPVHLVLLHTNDVHGQAQPRPATWIDRENPPPVGGLPRLAAYVKQVRREAEESGAGVLLVDGGDWFQGTPEGLVDRGRSFVNALSKVGYDAMTVGNHELDYGVEPLAAMVEDYRIPAVCANVFAGEERITWADPWRIVEVNGLRVGIVGLLTPVTPSITHEDAGALRFEDPAVALEQARSELGDSVDWILPITHLGVQGDRRLAKAHPDLDVIVGGHSHTYLKSGVRQGETLIVQAGSKASAVGRLDLWFDADSKELKKMSYRMADLLQEPMEQDHDEVVDEICGALVSRSELELSETVGELAAPLTRSFKRFSSTPAGNLITDTMREHMGGDVAVQNRGGIRCDLPEGPVSRRSLFEFLPFGNHLTLVEVSGEQLFECVRASVEGTAHTGLEVSGMKIIYRLDDEDKAFLVDLVIDGEPLDREKKYRLVTNNFLAGGGDGYEVLKTATRLREDPILLREILEQRFRREKRIEPLMDKRYVRSGL